MSDRHELEATKELLEKTGKGFCAAKWYNATIWLSNGKTASCHHPIAHSISKEELEQNRSALHNTSWKKQQRKDMLEGKRPDECGYCWRVEDADASQLSDRTFKSHIYKHSDITKLTELPWDQNINPKTLEVSFDHLCNLSCSYCNSEFSTTWANDIKTNGAYEGMQTPGGYTYRQAYEFDSDPAKETNIYVEKFLEWFNSELKYELEEMRVTGGEPSRSPHFWFFFDQCKDEKFKFSVNSNLQMNFNQLDRLIACSKKFNDFELFTSAEASGEIGELVRHGLKYNTWLDNIHKFATRASYSNINVMMTISALVLFGITDFLDDIIKLKKEFKNPENFHLSVNILRFPSFQSVNTLPQHIKQERANAISTWLKNNKQSLCDDEIASLERLVSYLINIESSYEDSDSVTNKNSDFYNFFKQYTDRRNLDMLKVFQEHKEFCNWWQGLSVNGPKES